MTALYSLDEVATAMRLREQMKDPVRWLTKQIKTGRITARRVGRSWCMTQADVDAAVERWASAPKPRVVEPVRIGLSAASQRRRSA
jgi:hypothetical protein